MKSSFCGARGQSARQGTGGCLAAAGAPSALPQFAVCSHDHLLAARCLAQRTSFSKMVSA